jgi:transcription elongation factor GreB
MSRAFVDEDDSMASESAAPEIKVPIPEGSRNYLTPEGADRLSRELHELVEVERHRILADIARTTSDGNADRDESAAFRRALGSIDRRIEYLVRMSMLAEVMTPPEGGYDRVKFGARVVVRDEAGRESEYRIVGVDEAEPERGLIGWTSPVARALMGRLPGERTVAKLPSGEKRLLVLSVG